MEKEEENFFWIWIVCRNKKRRSQLASIIRRRFAGVDVRVFAKMDDLPRNTTEKVVAIIMSLVGGQADVSWEIGVLYRRRFSGIPLLVEVDKDTSQERALRLIELGAWHVFGTEENAADVIESVIGPLYGYPNLSEVTRRYAETGKTFLQKIKIALKMLLWLFWQQPVK